MMYVVVVVVAVAVALKAEHAIAMWKYPNF